MVAPRKSKRARSRKSSATRLGRAIKTAFRFARPVTLLLAAVLIIVGYRTLASSELFELRRIEVNDATPSLGEDITQLVRRTVGETKLLDLNLDKVREKIETLPRVRQASVARMLPDGISVHVLERQPAVLVRRESGAVVWLDEDAVEMGDLSSVGDEGEGSRKIPPLARGFSEGGRSAAAIAEDRERIDLYNQIKKEFSQGSEPIWEMVDEIDLTFTRNINLRLSNSPVNIVIGSKDFRNRFDMALQVLSAIKRGDTEMLGRFRVQEADRLIENADRINFIDAARPDRIVLNFSSAHADRISRQVTNEQEDNKQEPKKQEDKPKKRQEPAARETVRTKQTPAKKR